MLSRSNKANPNYLAKVVQLGTPIKHPGADRLQGFIIDGNRVWTGMTAKEGDIYVYFPLECVITDKILKTLNLYSSPEQNLDSNVKGYFPKQGRVRAVRLRGEPSEGFILSFEEVEKIIGYCTGIKNFREDNTINQEFDTWNDELVVWKYVPQVDVAREKTYKSDKKKVRRFNRLVDGQFQLHADTENLRKNIHKLQPEDEISLSYKLHGTSFVVGNILTKRKRTFKERIAKWFGVVVDNELYDIVYSSRTVVKNQYETKDHKHYYGYDLWADIKDVLKDKLQKGITVYGEAVGYTRTGSMIQKGYDYGYTVPDMSIQQSMREYKEGVHFGIYIYRITYTNIDGYVVEFSSDQIIEYCTKYDIKTVPYLWQGLAKNYHWIDGESNWNEKFLEDLSSSKEYGHQNVNCYLCKNKVPAEGIVLRINRLERFEAYKLKSFKFLERESAELDKGEVDIETEQTVSNEEI